MHFKCIIVLQDQMCQSIIVVHEAAKTEYMNALIVPQIAIRINWKSRNSISIHPRGKKRIISYIEMEKTIKKKTAKFDSVWTSLIIYTQ